MIRRTAPAGAGTTCVKKCLDAGATAVFVSEQATDMFEVEGATKK